MIAELQFTEVMFVGLFECMCTRKIAFFESGPDCLEDEYVTTEYVTRDIGNCREVVTGFTPSATHTGYLPGVTDSGLSDQGDYALTELPFCRTGQIHWEIRAEGNRWEVDNSSFIGPELATYQQVVVR